MSFIGKDKVAMLIVMSSSYKQHFDLHGRTAQCSATIPLRAIYFLKTAQTSMEISLDLQLPFELRLNACLPVPPVSADFHLIPSTLISIKPQERRPVKVFVSDKRLLFFMN